MLVILIRAVAYERTMMVQGLEGVARFTDWLRGSKGVESTADAG